MRRRGGTVSLHCKHPGCTASSFGEYRSAAERNDWYDRALNWRCSKHAHPDRVLTLESTTKSCVLVATRLDGSLYWVAAGQEASAHLTASGISYGPGFCADAKDWPEGTELRVTAEIVPAARRERGK